MSKRSRKFKRWRLWRRVKYSIENFWIEHITIPIGGKRDPVPLEWEDDYDFVTDKIIPNGVPKCPYCGEMPYSYEQCQFCGQRFTKASQKMGNIPDVIHYTSPNGYSGSLYGRSSMSIFDPKGNEVLHTGSRTANTLEELKKNVDSYPEYWKKLQSIMKKPVIDDVVDI